MEPGKEDQTLADQQLVSRALQGDAASLGQLIRRHLGLVYSIAKHYVVYTDDAEDVTQEVFIKVWKNLKKFQPEKSFRNWLYEITKNTALDWLKRKRAAPFSSFENEYGENPFIETVRDPAASPQERAEQTILAEMLRTTVAKLSPVYKEVVTLHDAQGLTFQEIAGATNQPANTVKSRYRRALAQLRKFLLNR
ncbi:MAG: sigma-70 family RNA polymerase sigma factor [Patescibacteria group bacterium]|nr:sigma-70 family RNA polymerase sigma factor [Patescibacteria group bacterium]